MKWSAGSAPCPKVDPATSMLNGVPIDSVASYRVTVNFFLADAGDNVLVLKEGTHRLGGEVDTDAFETCFAANWPVASGPQDRITQQPLTGLGSDRVTSQTPCLKRECSPKGNVR